MNEEEKKPKAEQKVGHCPLFFSLLSHEPTFLWSSSRFLFWNRLFGSVGGDSNAQNLI